MKDKELLVDITNAIEILEKAKELIDEKEKPDEVNLWGGWVVVTDGSIEEVSKYDGETCLKRCNAQGRWFPTKQQAEAFSEYERAVERVKKWKGENCERWERGYCYIIWWDSQAVVFECSYYGLSMPLSIYLFASAVDARACIKACRANLDIIREYMVKYG